jgi:hypothetical protein
MAQEAAFKIGMLTMQLPEITFLFIQSLDTVMTNHTSKPRVWVRPKARSINKTMKEMVKLKPPSLREVRALRNPLADLASMFGYMHNSNSSYAMANRYSITAT